MLKHNTMKQSFRTPLDMFYHWESTKPDTIWLRQRQGDEWIDYTWRDAGQASRSLATAMAAMGVNKDDKIGILAVNSANWFFVDIAIMMLGAVSVPIYTTMSEDKIAYIIDESEMKVLFADAPQTIPLLKQLQASGNALQVVAMDDSDARCSLSDLLGTPSTITGNPAGEPDDLWTLIYTSGTTGLPKGVMHSYRTLPSSAKELHEAINTTESTRYLSYLPLAHVAERAVVELQSLYCGGSVGFSQSKDAFLSDLGEIRPTFFLAVPRIWAILKTIVIQEISAENWLRAQQDSSYAKTVGSAVFPKLGLDQVEFAMTGSAPTPRDDVVTWQQLGMPLCEAYGMSETLSATYNQKSANRVGSVGRPLTGNTRIKISSEGEILLHTQGNMLGYYNSGEKTAEVMRDGWIHTGDKGYLDPEGYLFITGRIKDIFKTAKGKYVAPVPIEEKFSALPCIEQCCLVGSGMIQPVLLIVLNNVASDPGLIKQQLHALLDDVNPALESHERVSHTIICQTPWTIENGLLTPTLKIRRSEIEQRYGSLVSASTKGFDDKVLWE